jgi:hypothetical protein
MEHSFMLCIEAHSDKPGGDARHDFICFDIFCHHSSGGHDGAVADPNTGQDDDSLSDPHIVADDGLIVIGPAGENGWTTSDIDPVVGPHNSHIGSKHGVLSNAHLRRQVRSGTNACKGAHDEIGSYPLRSHNHRGGIHVTQTMAQPEECHPGIPVSLIGAVAPSNHSS